MNITLNYTDQFTPVQLEQIEASRLFLIKVLSSDEFKWKARKYKERDSYLELMDGYIGTVKRLIPEGAKNRRALYNKKTQTTSINIPLLQYETTESLAGLLGHEIGHQWFDHKELEIGSFLGFIQYKLKFMKGKSNWYYKFLLWISKLFK